MNDGNRGEAGVEEKGNPTGLVIVCSFSKIALGTCIRVLEDHLERVWVVVEADQQH